MRSFTALPLAVGIAVLTILASGGTLVKAQIRAEPTRPQGGSSVPPPELKSGSSLEERRARFLTRIRAADPQKATIERAVLNSRNELGLILSRRADLDSIPKLMKMMLAQLDAAFPHQDQTVIAYTPTDPPRVIGTAHLDARTRDMTYQPVSTH